MVQEIILVTVDENTKSIKVDEVLQMRVGSETSCVKLKEEVMDKSLS